MNLKETIFEYIRNYLKGEKLYPVIGVVSDINDTERSCTITPIIGDSERKARLQASLNLASGLYIKPKNASKVLFHYLNKETGVITCFSEIESINLDVESIIINGGSLGGLVKVSDLVEKLNIIEDSLNDLKAAFNGWTPSYETGLKTALTTWTADILTKTEVEDLENEKVKQ
jgi:hypothetical protein